MSLEHEPISLIDHLDKSSLGYQIITETDIAADPNRIDVSRAAKSILFQSSGDFALAVLPVSEKVNSKKLKGILGSNSLRFASRQELLDEMGCVPGECHPFGTLNNIRTFADHSLERRESLFFSTGVAGKIIEISFENYFQVARPQMVDIIN